MSSAEATTTPSLQALLDAFNAHDVDAILSLFTEDCVYDAPRGPAPGGRRFVGKDQVRKGFQGARPSTGSRGSSTRLPRDGKISRKDSFWKIID